MERDQIADDCNFPAVNFNSHAHVERDAKTAMTIRMIFNFNSHAHVERDVLHGLVNIDIGYFNSHAHVERDSARCENR